MKNGSYTVPRLGIRKKAILKAGSTVLDLAVAMLETEHMMADYQYGDGKTGDAANFGIFKQNWLMIRTSAGLYANRSASDYHMGAALNNALNLDIQVLHASQSRYGLNLWFAGHRKGQSGLNNSNTADINNYRNAVYWIRDQITRTRGAGPTTRGSGPTYPQSENDRIASRVKPSYRQEIAR